MKIFWKVLSVPVGVIVLFLLGVDILSLFFIIVTEGFTVVWAIVLDIDILHILLRYTFIICGLYFVFQQWHRETTKMDQ